MVKRYNRKKAVLGADAIRNSKISLNSAFALGLGNFSYTMIKLILICLQQLEQAQDGSEEETLADGKVELSGVILAFALNIPLNSQNIRWLVKEFKKLQDVKFLNLFHGIYVAIPVISSFEYVKNDRTITVQLSPVFLAAAINGDEQYQLAMNDALEINSKYGLIIYNLLAKERHSAKFSTTVQAIDDLSQIFFGKPTGEVKSFKSTLRNSTIRAIDELNDNFEDQSFSFSALKNGHTIWGYKLEQIEKN